MRPIAAFAHLMSTHVWVQAQTGADGYGKPSYGPAVRYQAHIGQRKKFVRTAGGEEIESGQSIYLNTKVSILPTARLTLTTGDAGSTEDELVHPTIIAVERLSDQNGPHHVTLFL